MIKSSYILPNGFRIFFVIVILISLFGCFTTNRPKARFYKSAKFKSVGGDHGTVEFDLHIKPAKETPPKIVTQLPEKALAKIIEIYGNDNNLKAKLPTLLASQIKKPQSLPSFDNSLVKFKKNFTFTIIPKNFHPADRLFSATLAVTVPEGWQFTGWSGFKAKDRTVNFAKIESELSQKHSSSIKLAPPQIKELSEATFGTERARTDSLEKDLNFEIIEFLPRLDDHNAELTLNAPFPQINVAGSYSVDISFEFKHPAVQRFIEFEFENGKLKNHKLRALRYIPNLNKAGMGKSVPDQLLKKVKLTFIERLVYNPKIEDDKTGASTADEGDDVAIYREGTVEKTSAKKNNAPSFPPGPEGITFLEGEEVRAVLLLALYEGNPVYLHDRYSHRPNDAQCLLFRNGNQAQQFAAWVTGESVPRVSGNGRDGREWKLQIDQNGKFIDLKSSDLVGKVSPFIFEAISLNNPKETEKLNCKCKPRS